MPVPPLPFPDDLETLVADLCASAEQDAAAVRATAAAQARHTARAAEEEARSVLEDAKRTGARAAAGTAAGRRAETRRAARELMLSTRRRVLDRLRAESVARLAADLDQPGGVELRQYLRSLVAEVAGARDVQQLHTAGGWVLTAPVTSGEIELDLGDLVDQIIASLAEELDSLWQ